MDKRLLKNLCILILSAVSSTGIFAADSSSVATATESSMDESSGYQEWVNEDKDKDEQAQPPSLASPQNVYSKAPTIIRTPASTQQKSAPNASQSNEDNLVISKPMSYERSQRIMLNSAPPGGNKISSDSDDAFNALMRQNIPLNPKQVIKLRQLIDNSQRAAAIPATVPPKPVSTTIMMNLAPGTTPPAIRLSQGYVTSLVFVDSTGAPWPIAAFDVGDPKASRIQWDGKSNVLIIQGVNPYGDSDLVVRLAGLMTPITLELVSGQRVVDFRTDIHVAGIGPNAKDLPTGTGLPNSANQVLLDVLDGVGPAGSKLLTVTGGDCQAWLFGDKMYLRTRLTVLSPGWVGRMVSPDGMYAYEIQRSATVLVSRYGTPVELRIEDF